MSRALSRLRQLFCTFGHKTDALSNEGAKHLPYTTDMYMLKGGDVNPAVRVHIGSAQYPQKRDVDSTVEFIYRLQLALGSHDSELLNHGIRRKIYEGDSDIEVD